MIFGAVFLGSGKTAANCSTAARAIGTRARASAAARPTAVIPKSVTPARIQANLEDVLALTLDADVRRTARLEHSSTSGGSVRLGLSC